MKTYGLICCAQRVYVILNFGIKRYLKIRNAAKSSAVFYQLVKKNERKYRPLKDHFEYLQNLGEVRAMQVVMTLVDGMGGHSNRDDNIDVTYLPISMVPLVLQVVHESIGI